MAAWAPPSRPPKGGKPGACWLRPGPLGRSSAPGPRARALAPAWPSGPPSAQPGPAPPGGGPLGRAATPAGEPGRCAKSAPHSLPSLAPGRGKRRMLSHGAGRSASQGKRRRQRLRRWLCLGLVHTKPSVLHNCRGPVRAVLDTQPGHPAISKASRAVHRSGRKVLSGAGRPGGAWPFSAYKTGVLYGPAPTALLLPIRCQGAAAAQRRRAVGRLYGPPLRRGSLGGAPARPPALAPAWPFGPPSAQPGAQRFRKLVGGPPPMVIGS